MWDIPERSLEPPEGKVIGWCKYCYNPIFEDEEWYHMECLEEHEEETA